MGVALAAPGLAGAPRSGAGRPPLPPRRGPGADVQACARQPRSDDAVSRSGSVAVACSPGRVVARASSAPLHCPRPHRSAPGGDAGRKVRRPEVAGPVMRLLAVSPLPDVSGGETTLLRALPALGR